MAKKCLSFTVADAEAVGTSIGIDWTTCLFTPDDLVKGMDVELEHGSILGDKVNITNDDPEMTAKIAWAHLMENPKYYDFLATMESSMEKAKEKEGAVMGDFDAKLLDARVLNHLNYTDAYEGEVDALEYLVESILANDPSEEDFWAVDKKFNLELKDGSSLEDMVTALFRKVVLPLHQHSKLTQAGAGSYNAVLNDEDGIDLWFTADEEELYNLREILYGDEDEREASVKKQAVIKPCRAKDFDPKRDPSAQRVCLYTHDGKRLLGRHPDEESARRQEVAIKVKGGSVKTKKEVWLKMLNAGYVPPTVKKQGKTLVPDLNDAYTRRAWEASQKKFGAGPELGPEYAIPISIHDEGIPIEVWDLAALLYGGQGDPLYALLSRVKAYGETLASLRELHRLENALDLFLEDLPSDLSDEDWEEFLEEEGLEEDWILAAEAALPYLAEIEKAYSHLEE